MKETIEELIESARKLDESTKLEDSRCTFLWRQDYTQHGMLKVLNAISESLKCSKAEAAMIYWLQSICRRVSNIEAATCIPQEQKGNINWEDEEDDDTTNSIDNLND